MKNVHFGASGVQPAGIRQPLQELDFHAVRPQAVSQEALVGIGVDRQKGDFHNQYLTHVHAMQ